MNESENESENDARFFAHLRSVLLYHQRLLRDEVRNRLFYEALKLHITPETRVLDIGAGSGVWAITAAQLGAKKVVAIEADDAMIPVLMNHVRENGVGDQVEIIHGLSQDVNPRHKFEVVISETIGNSAFEENIAPIMIDARKRFLARGGVLIPQKVALFAAPAHLETETETALGVPFKSEYLRRLSLNLISRAADKNRLRLVGEPQKLHEEDLRVIEKVPALSNMSAKWKLENVSEANVFLIWAVSELADGIILDNFKTSSWSPVICRFNPLKTGEDELEFTLTISQNDHHWTVRSSDKTEKFPQSYAPFFAYTKIKMGLQSAPRPRKPRLKKD